MYTYIDTDDNRIMTLNFTSNNSENDGENAKNSENNSENENTDGESPLWQKGDFPSSMSNPWRSGDDSAPFDERFYISIAVAVGGVSSHTYTHIYTHV
jgi:hypothetical protein